VVPSRDPMDEYQRNRRWMDLVHLPLVEPERISNQRALQHLKEGFTRRMLMIDASLRTIGATSDAAGGKPISPYAAIDLATHLNALYLNFCGALDNLAWALQYELGILPGVSETSKGRLKVGLFSRSFLQSLEKVAVDLPPVIRGHAAWHDELHSLRDPAAHRIPIYAVPGVMNENQGEQAKQLGVEATRLILEGKTNAGMELMFQASNLGTYQPLMSLSHEGRFEFRHISPQVAADQTHLIQVAEPVLRRLFEQRGSVGHGQTDT
jgi:hypothetical protein